MPAQLAMDYTQQDLDDFAAYVPVMNDGGGMRKDFSVRFLMMGWLVQTGTAPVRFEITPFGMQHLPTPRPTN